MIHEQRTKLPLDLLLLYFILRSINFIHVNVSIVIRKIFKLEKNLNSRKKNENKNSLYFCVCIKYKFYLHVCNQRILTHLCTSVKAKKNNSNSCYRYNKANGMQTFFITEINKIISSFPFIFFMLCISYTIIGMDLTQFVII